MVRRYMEISCDTCNCACHYLIGYGSAEKQARREGWIITANGKHYDTAECYKKSWQQKSDWKSTH